MNGPYRLRYTPEALEGISKLTADLKKIAERILLHLAAYPQSGKPLTGKLKGMFSARITRRYRVLYLLKHKDREIVILDVKHRKDAYGD